jgi:hypothetical protein
MEVSREPRLSRLATKFTGEENNIMPFNFIADHFIQSITSFSCLPNPSRSFSKPQQVFICVSRSPGDPYPFTVVLKAPPTPPPIRYIRLHLEAC